MRPFREKAEAFGQQSGVNGPGDGRIDGRRRQIGCESMSSTSRAALGGAGVAVILVGAMLLVVRRPKNVSNAPRAAL